MIDPSNRITESNKKNNSHARTYTPNFCLHKWQPNTKITGDIGVQVLDTAFFGNVDMSLYEDNLAAWNGITDNLEVVRATVTSSEEIMPDYNVLVRGRVSPGNYESVNAETIIPGNYARIDLFTDIMGNRTMDQNVRTFIHEMGHAFNLWHPNDNEPCSYKSIMYQSGNDKKSDEITLHDQNNLYKLHDNSAKTLSSEPQTNEILTEYQINTVNAIDIFSLDELEGLAEYVVKGRILDNGENIHTKYSQYTKTGFEISDVYKGDLEAGDIIYIGEDYFKESIEGVETSFYYNGYTKSVPEKEYIFFLVKKPNFDEYGLAYSSLSRYSLDSNAQLKPSIDTHSCNSEVFSEDNYTNIKQDVLLRYQ